MNDAAQAVQDRLALVQSATSLESLFALLLPVPMRELLRRCAVAHLFDERLVDEVLRPAVTGGDAAAVPFAKLVALDVVEPVPHAAGWYRLAPDDRRYYLGQWRDALDTAAASAEFVELNGALADFFERLGVAWQSESLYHLLVHDPKRAEPLLDTLFAAADARFDLATCGHLLAIVGEQEQFLSGSSLVRRLHELRGYLTARSTTADDYYRTARYYERETLRDVTGQLFAPDGPWMLNLHATGGMGKTMYLRWLIARRCVPDGVWCARVDFDDVKPSEPHEPWHLLTLLAKQLEAQRPGTFASALTLMLGWSAPSGALPLPGGSAGAMPDHEAAASRTALALDFFAGALQGLGGRRVVLILDTLEVAVRRPYFDLAALLRTFHALHAGYPALRLVLAGRDDLHVRVPGFTDLVGDMGDRLDVSVSRFDDADAAGYLTEKRALPDTDVLDAIVNRAGGLPFKLALFADVLQSKPRLSAAEVRAYPRVDLLYLIERVMLRIANFGVRWLLRYGVVPRQLTFEFVRDVMAPHLRRASEGDHSYDDPTLREVDVDVVGGEVWPSVPLDTSDDALRALWVELTQYAGSASWITTGPGGSLVVQSDVVNPMRRMLRDWPVFERLHADAVAHFVQRAESDPDNGAEHLSEGLYHEFQRRGPVAGWTWLEWMRQSRAAPVRRQRLAREVLDPVYGATESLAAGQPDVALVSPALLARAQFELARADVELARTASHAARAELHIEAERALDKAAAAERALGVPVLPVAAMVTVRVPLLVRAARGAEAEQLVQQALAGDPSVEDQVALHRAYGDVLHHRRDRGAEEHYHAALQLASSRADWSTDELLDLRERLTRQHAEFDRLGAAMDACRTALGTLPRGTTLPHLTRLLATLELRAGLSARASATAARAMRVVAPTRLSSDQRMPFVLLVARALLEQRQPLAAARTLRQIERLRVPRAGVKRAVRPGTDLDRTTMAGLAAQHAEYTGRAQAMLLDFRAALASTDEARRRWIELGEHELAERCLQRCVEMQMRDVGSLRVADQLLEQARPLDEGRRSERAVYLAALRAEWLDRTGEGARARHALHELIEGCGPGARPRILVRLALTGLARQHEPSPVMYLQQLDDALRQMDLASARLALLDPLARCPTVRNAPRALVNSLLRLTNLGVQPAAARAMAGRRDALALAPARVELQRVLGKHSAARRTLSQALGAGLHHGAAVLRVVELRRAQDRLGWTAGAISKQSQAIARVLRTYRAAPSLTGAFLVEETERRLAAGDHAAASQLVRQAARRLAAPDVLRTQWSARLLVAEALLRAAADPAGRDLVLRAMEEYEQLQDAPRKRELASLLKIPASERDPNDASARPPQTTLPEALLVRVTVRNADVMVRAPGAPAQWARVGTPGDAEDAIVWGLRDDAAATRRGRQVSHRLLSLLRTSWPTLGTRLAHELPPLLSRVPTPPTDAASAVDLRIEADRAFLLAFPWEVLRDPAANDWAVRSPRVRYVYRGASGEMSVWARVRWMQAALSHVGTAPMHVDGIYGERTRAAMGAFQQARGLEPSGIDDDVTRSLLRAAVREMAVARGRRRTVLIVDAAAQPARPDEQGGTAHDAFYRRAGFEVLTARSARELQEMLVQRTPDVVHVRAMFQESETLREVYLAPRVDDEEPSAPSEVERGASEEIRSPSAFDRLLGSLPDNAPGPLVVLDAVRPPFMAEAVRQLLLRNLFAAELFLCGNVPAVLACGLGDDVQQMRAMGALTFGLGALQPMGETARAMRSSAMEAIGPEDGEWSEERLGALLPSLAIALFAHDPEALTLPHPSRTPA